VSTTGSLARFVRWCSIGVQSPGSFRAGRWLRPPADYRLSYSLLTRSQPAIKIPKKHAPIINGSASFPTQ